MTAKRKPKQRPTLAEKLPSRADAAYLAPQTKLQNNELSISIPSQHLVLLLLQEALGTATPRVRKLEYAKLRVLGVTRARPSQGGNIGRSPNISPIEDGNFDGALQAIIRLVAVILPNPLQHPPAHP